MSSLAQKDRLNRIKLRFHIIVRIVCGGGDDPYDRDHYIETRLIERQLAVTLYFKMLCITIHTLCFIRNLPQGLVLKVPYL